MHETIPKKYAGLIGLGLMFMWGCAILYWVEWTNSYSTFENVIGTVGGMLVSASGLGIFLYTNDIESKLKEQEKQNAFNREQAEYWQDQAQTVIEVLERERKARNE